MNVMKWRLQQDKLDIFTFYISMNYWCMVNTFVIRWGDRVLGVYIYWLRGLSKTLFDSLIKTTKWTWHKIRKTFSRLLVLRWCIYGMVYITLVTQLLYLTLSLQILMSCKISSHFTYKEKKRFLQRIY